LQNSSTSKIITGYSVGLRLPHNGCQVVNPKGNGHLAKPGEWLNPWLKLLKLLNLALSHAAAAISLAFLWWLVGNVIDNISVQQLPWMIMGVTISLSEIIHYGDFSILIAFFVKLLIDLFTWPLRS
jgi:hypothetical protein